MATVKIKNDNPLVSGNITTEQALQIANAVMAICKHQVSKNRSLDNIDLEAVVTPVVLEINKGAVNNVDGRLSEVIYPEDSEFEKRSGESFDDYYERTTKLLDDMQAISDNLPLGQIVGGIIGFSVADGKALYKVTQDEPLVIEHIPYGDCYHAPTPFLQGLDTDYIHNELLAKRQMNALFRNQKP